MAMTPGEIFKREVDNITQRTGRYIPPYRLASLMKTAQKVTDLITKSDVCVTYEESMMVLSIVRSAIREITGEGEQ